MRAIRRRLAVRLGAAADDRGLTLIELLAVIAILGIIVAPLSAALISYFQHTDETTERLSLSHDVQISSAYFAQDVQSMGKRDWDTDGFPFVQSVYAGAGSPYPCGPAGTPAPVVQLVWDDPATGKNGKVWRVSYYLKSVGGGLSELHRIICPGTSTTASDVVMAHNVDSAKPPALNCSGGCFGGTPPMTVTLVLHLRPKNSTVNDPLTVTLTGQRRTT